MVFATNSIRVRHCGTVNMGIQPCTATDCSASIVRQISLYSASIQSSLVPSKCSLYSTRFPSKHLPFSIRYRGDSGRKIIPMTNTNAGTTWKASGNRHWN